jgi:hypothetical protein
MIVLHSTPRNSHNYYCINSAIIQLFAEKLQSVVVLQKNCKSLGFCTNNAMGYSFAEKLQ